MHSSILKESASNNIQGIIPFENYALFTCRIEPENNIDLILEAYSKMEALYLVGIGNWTNSNYGRKLHAKYSGLNNILLLDYISDQNLLNAIKVKSDLYVHGHSAGGTNPSLVEAMYLGLPVLAYDVPYNRETTENGALYFSSIANLTSQLNKILNLEVIEISKEMKSIAMRRYTWQIITDKYESLFQ